jgi:hypothetical protein
MHQTTIHFHKSFMYKDLRLATFVNRLQYFGLSGSMAPEEGAVGAHFAIAPAHACRGGLSSVDALPTCLLAG